MRHFKVVIKCGLTVGITWGNFYDIIFIKHRRRGL